MYHTVSRHAVFALLLALALVWPATAQAGGITVATWEELKTAINGDHNHEIILLKNDLEATDVAAGESGIRPPNSPVDVALSVSGACTLNLGGHTLTLHLSPIEAPECTGIAVLPDGTLTVENGTLRIQAEYALVNTGTMILQDLTVEGTNAAVLDVGNAYTEIRSGFYHGLKGAGYYNYGTNAYIENGYFEGPLYGYFGAPMPKNITFKNAQFHTFGDALHNVGSEPLVAYLAPGATISQNGQPVDLSASPYVVTGDAVIGITAPCSNRVINLFIGDTDLYVTDEQLVHTIPMDVAPYINVETNRTMLPVRFVGEALGMEVAYDVDSRSVTLTDAHHTIVLTLDSPEAFRNGGAFVLDTPPAVVKDRTMLPIGEIADMMGLSRTDDSHSAGYIEWDGERQHIFITRPC